MNYLFKLQIKYKFKTSSLQALESIAANAFQKAMAAFCDRTLVYSFPYEKREAEFGDQFYCQKVQPQKFEMAQFFKK